MTQVLSLSARPLSFDELVGQKSLVRKIQAHMEKRKPAAWMFIGESGAGKTTIARIIATSLNCVHQTVFGNPCEKCRKGVNNFDIVEVNCGEYSTKDEIETIISGAYYSPKGGSKYRAYIFDEAQQIAGGGQTALLKYFEDSPSSTVWFICTTDPGKIKKALRRRCMTYVVPGLSVQGVEKLVAALILKTGEKKKPEPLAEALLEQNVTSPGFIATAVEKYLAGEEAERAAMVMFDSAIDTLRVCRAVVKGDWDDVKSVVQFANSEDVKAIRASLGGYLKAIMVNGQASRQASNCASAIAEMVPLTYVEDGLQVAGTVAALYRICKLFR